VRDLYAVAGQRWAEEGRERHFALVPAVDAELEPWYRLSFAQMQLDAIRPSGGTVTAPPAGVTIRPGGPEDLETVALQLAGLIWEHQALPPAFTGLTPPPPEEARADWAETLEASDVTYFVALEDRRAVGHSVLYPPDPDFGIPRDAVRLAATATLPDARGRGIGLALLEHGLAWAEEAGYATVVTDWRVPNLLASRFWPARGFRPTFHRLSRQLRTG
jgi:GNAT superfamily N-acetyltransferase